jgi:HEAT repeat protein
LLGKMSPIQLLHVDDEVRRWWQWSWCGNYWERVSPALIRELPTDETTRSSVLGLFSFHRDGYVRHEAIRLLTQIHDGSELPYLLIRLNDWVEPIGADARHAVRSRISDQYLCRFVDNLPLAVHMLECRRRDQTEIVRQIILLLVQPRHDELLARAMNSEVREVRRSVVRLAIETSGEHRPRVIVHALRSDDGVIRLWGTERVRECFSGDQLERALGRLLRDPFMPVRRQALIIQSENSADSGREVWRRALLDGSASIRELARFSLGKMGNADFSTFYRQALKEQPASLAALCGLGETGDRSDVTVIQEYLRSPLPSRRRAAVGAFARLGGESVIPELIEHLRDDSPTVVREAMRYLERSASLLDGERLCRTVMVDERQEVRAAAIRLIDAMGKWRSLTWLIRTSTHRDRATGNLAQSLIESWFEPPRCNRVYTRPSEAERQAIVNALTECRPMMGETIARKIDAWMKG